MKYAQKYKIIYNNGTHYTVKGVLREEVKSIILLDGGVALVQEFKKDGRIVNHHFPCTQYQRVKKNYRISNPKSTTKTFCKKVVKQINDVWEQSLPRQKAAVREILEILESLGVPSAYTNRG